MPAEAPRIYTVVPQGLGARGGISRMAAYYARDWQDRGRTPALRVIDSYGPRDVWHMPVHFAVACLRILVDGLRGRIALLHLHMAEDGSTLRKAVLLLLGRSLGVPVVLHMHGARFAHSCARLPRPLARLLAAVLRRADMVLVLGGASRRFMVDELRLPAARVVVLANAVPEPPAPAAPAASGCRVLFLGALGERKGLDVLLAALATPGLARHDWHADIVGPGDVAAWRAVAQRMGIAHRVTWHGWQPPDRSQALLARAGLLVLPSRQEGLPMVILEAMAAGVAVVATPVGDVPDAVQHGRSGLLVPPGSVPQLAEAVGALISQPERRRAMGRAGRARYEQSFSIDAFGARLAALLQDVARRRTRRGAALRQVALLGFGAAAGQAMVMAASPLLTRLYPAEAFGGFGLFSGLAAAIGAVATLKFEQAILLERQAPEDVLRLCVALSVIAGAATFAAAWATGQPGWLIWGGPAVLVAGLVNALTNWGIRAARFRRLGLYQSTRSGLAVALQLGGAALGRDAGLLVGGQVVGQSVAALLLADGSAWAVLRRGWRWRGLAAVARRHRHLALYGAPQTLGHLLSVNLPSLLLPLCCGASAAGMFWLAYRILILPSQIVVESLRSVFFRSVAGLADRPAEARRTMRRASGQLALLGLPVALILLAAGPALFALVFGTAWRPAGIDAAIMALPWWLETVAVPASVMVVVLQLQRSYLAIELLSLGGRVGAILLGARLGGAVAAVALYAVVAGLSSLALMGLVERALRRRRPA